MESTIGNDERIVITNPLRERLGLPVAPAGGGAFRHRPPSDQPALIRKDGVLVPTGTAPLVRTAPLDHFNGSLDHEP